MRGEGRNNFYREKRKEKELNFKYKQIIIGSPYGKINYSMVILLCSEEEFCVCLTTVPNALCSQNIIVKVLIVYNTLDL